MPQTNLETLQRVQQRIYLLSTEKTSTRKAYKEQFSGEAAVAAALLYLDPECTKKEVVAETPIIPALQKLLQIAELYSPLKKHGEIVSVATDVGFLGKGEMLHKLDRAIENGQFENVNEAEQYFIERYCSGPFSAAWHVAQAIRFTPSREDNGTDIDNEIRRDERFAMLDFYISVEFNKELSEACVRNLFRKLGKKINAGIPLLEEAMRVGASFKLVQDGDSIDLSPQDAHQIIVNKTVNREILELAVSELGENYDNENFEYSVSGQEKFENHPELQSFGEIQYRRMQLMLLDV